MSSTFSQMAMAKFRFNPALSCAFVRDRGGDQEINDAAPLYFLHTVNVTGLTPNPFFHFYIDTFDLR